MQASPPPKIFVKSVIGATSIVGRNLDYGHAVRYNICISNRQECEPGAQQNLWREILEF